MSTTKETNVVSEFALVKAIVKLLKIGDQGKLESFFSRICKILKKEISALEKTLEVKKFEYERDLDDLKDKLEDAQEALSASLLQVDVERIKTNEDQNAYAEVYLSNIDIKQEEVISLENQIKALTENFEKEEASANAQINSLKKRLEEIGKK